MAKPELKNLFTAKEAIEALGYSARHFERLIVEHNIEPMYINPRMRVFTKKDITALKKKVVSR